MSKERRISKIKWFWKFSAASSDGIKKLFSFLLAVESLEIDGAIKILAIYIYIYNKIKYRLKKKKLKIYYTCVIIWLIFNSFLRDFWDSLSAINS